MSSKVLARKSRNSFGRAWMRFSISIRRYEKSELPDLFTQGPWRVVHGVRALDAQVVDGIVDEAGFKVRRLAQKAAGGDDLIQDELGLECGEFKCLVFSDFVDYRGKHRFRHAHAVAAALVFEDPPEA